MGMSPAEIKRRVAEEAGPLRIWPENWDAVRVFDAMITQWRQGPGGPSGLDYSVLPLVAGWLQVAPDRHSEMFAQIREMEQHAIGMIVSKRGHA